MRQLRRLQHFRSRRLVVVSEGRVGPRPRVEGEMEGLGQGPTIQFPFGTPAPQIELVGELVEVEEMGILWQGALGEPATGSLQYAVSVETRY